MSAALTRMLFLDDESAVAEILASGAAYYGFRNLAKNQTQLILLFSRTYDETLQHP